MSGIMQQTHPVTGVATTVSVRSRICLILGVSVVDGWTGGSTAHGQASGR